MEAVAAYASIGDKLAVRDIVTQIVHNERLSPLLLERIASRLNYDLPPLINHQGALEFPYLD